MKKILIVAILGVLTFFTPITLKADYTSIDTPVSELNYFTLDEVFTDISHPLTDYIVTTDPNYDLATEYQFTSLNNHTLSEVFEDLENVYYTLPNNVTNDFSIHDGKAYYVQRVQRYVLQASDITLLYTVLSNHDSVAFLIEKLVGRIPFTISAETHVIVDGWGLDISETQFNTNDVANIGKIYVNQTYFSFIVPKGIYANLEQAQSALAGTVIYYQLATPVEIELFDTSSLTVEQMDYLYSLYLDLKLIKDFELTIPHDVYDFTLPNNVTNEFTIINDKLYFVQNVQKYVLQASDISNLMTLLTNIDAIEIKMPIDYVAYKNLTYEEDFILENYPYINFLFDQTTSIGKVNNSFYFDANSNINFLLAVAKGSHSLSTAKTTFAGTVLYYQLATPITIEILPNDSISALQAEYLYSLYLDTTNTYFSGLEVMVDDTLYFKDDGVIFNIGDMVADKVYSPLNHDTFDNLNELQMENQFNQWKERNYFSISTLSYEEYLFYDSDGTVSDLETWNNLYQSLLDQLEEDLTTINENEELILIITLIVFIIGMALAIYFKHKIIFFITGLLWFVPIIIVPNIFIVVFSTAMIIIFSLLAFYDPSRKDFD